MALSTVNLTTLGLFDRWEYQAKAAELGITGGTDVWARVDAAGNEDYENYMKGFDATALDTAFAAQNMGYNPYMKAVLSDLKSYLAAIPAYATIDAWLLANKLRLNARAAAICAAAGHSLSVASIAGDADGGALAPGTSMGTLIRGGALTAGTDIVLTAASSSPILARVTTIGSADWTLSVTMKLWDATTKVIAQVVLGTGDGGAVGNTYVIGAQAIGGVTASGQKVVTCAATAQFKMGQTVLLTESSGGNLVSQEYGVIASIIENTSITLAVNLLNAYTAAGFIYPCGIGVSAASGSGGTASDAVRFGIAPERVLAL